MTDKIAERSCEIRIGTKCYKFVTMDMSHLGIKYKQRLIDVGDKYDIIFFQNYEGKLTVIKKTKLDQYHLRHNNGVTGHPIYHAGMIMNMCVAEQIPGEKMFEAHDCTVIVKKCNLIDLVAISWAGKKQRKDDRKSVDLEENEKIDLFKKLLYFAISKKNDREKNNEIKYGIIIGGCFNIPSTDAKVIMDKVDGRFLILPPLEEGKKDVIDYFIYMEPDAVKPEPTPNDTVDDYTTNNITKDLDKLVFKKEESCDPGDVVDDAK